jgi:hypothetical protein
VYTAEYDNKLSLLSSNLSTGPPTWSFDYIYYTESDQVLLVRIMRDLYAHLKVYPRRMLIPHRLMPYPNDVLTKIHGRDLHDVIQISSEIKEDDNEETGTWGGSSCCLPRQNCIERRSWKHVSNKSAIPIASIYGIQVPLGNSHYRIESYRGCKWKNNRVAQCP